MKLPPLHPNSTPEFKRLYAEALEVTEQGNAYYDRADDLTLEEIEHFNSLALRVCEITKRMAEITTAKVN